MTCSLDDFLLLLMKWVNSSSKVMVSFAEGTGEPSESIILRFHGRIASVDPKGEFFIFADTDRWIDGSFVFVGVAGCTFSFGFGSDLPAAGQVPVGTTDAIDELVTIGTPAGSRMALFTLKD